ncbi:FAD-binding protein [Kitasatospora atroaurantiaca]|uniref:FAD-binding protein n=2 Tax=Kitasatospora atroaurantiaca TaxID=285545 RepID=UPI003CCC6EA7
MRCATTGLVIDLSPMKGVRIDPMARTVRAEAGLTWGEVNHDLQHFGLAATGGFISTTGVAGLTLGGGLGWLVRKHGSPVTTFCRSTSSRPTAGS